MINEFRGKYYFLSNFYSCKVEWEGLTYENNEAEMRTYGESFIIVDQSPSMLDSAAIRNTNTKIVLSLPDTEDRKVNWQKSICS